MIKQLIAAALAVATFTTQAKDFAWTPNEANGNIVLQTYKCTMPDLSHLYSVYHTSAGGKTAFGCWWYESASDSIHVVWASGNRFTYAGSIFTLFDKK